MLDVRIQFVDLHLDCFVCVFGLLPSAFSLYVPVFVSQNDRQHLKKYSLEVANEKYSSFPNLHSSRFPDRAHVMRGKENWNQNKIA